MATTAPSIVNGVNLQQLIGTIALIKEQPTLAKFTFRARTEWKSGGRSETRIRSFYGAGAEDTSRTSDHVLVGDEPAVLLGTDGGANAVEAVLHALASCIAVGFAYNAAARGITLHELAIEQEGDLDLRAFLGLSEDVRPGYERIRFRYHVKADAPRQTLVELCDYVQKTSPVLDIVRNPIPVSIEMA